MAISQTTENAPDAPRNDRSRQVDDPPGGVRIADWTVEPVLNRLSRNGEVIRLEPKVMTVLVYLAERPGQAVSREELEEKVWAGSIVSYDALTGAIQKLRKAFNDDSYTVTVSGTLPNLTVTSTGTTDAGFVCRIESDITVGTSSPYVIRIDNLRINE